MILCDPRVVQRLSCGRLYGDIESGTFTEELLHRRQVLAAQLQRLLLLPRRQLQLILQQPTSRRFSAMVRAAIEVNFTGVGVPCSQLVVPWQAKSCILASRGLTMVEVNHQYCNETKPARNPHESPKGVHPMMLRT